MNRNQNQTRSRNLILLAAVVVLLALSVFTYRDSVQRANRFERGQKFLPHLDLDQIAEIVLRQGGEPGGDGKSEEVVLRRTAGGDRFVVTSAHGYRADNAEVNRLLRKLLDLKLEKEVGAATEKLTERLGLRQDEQGLLPKGTLEVVLRNSTDQGIVRFLVGQESDDGASGRYLLRLGESEAGGGTIYLTQGRVDLRVDGDAFVDKEILDVPRTDLVAIRGEGFSMVRGEDGELRLEGLQEGQKQSSKATSLQGLLSPLRFTTHHLADAPEVRDLEFTRSVHIELADNSGYEVEFARPPGSSDGYVRVRGLNSTEQVLIDRDASEDEVRETSEVLVRADEINEFNEFHGSWIYGVSQAVADRLDVGASDVIDR